MGTWWKILVVLALAAACGGAFGCSINANGPRMRMGSLPFPGMFSLYAEADPDDLGVHCSGPQIFHLHRPWECERGTLYTRRAGFVDLSHVRDTIDWVYVLHGHVEEALGALGGSEGDPAGFALHYCQARFEVWFDVPPWWGSLDERERGELRQELAIRAAQRLSIVLATWHECATWLGHQTVPGIPETWSAFTWDDCTAHVIGAIVGGRALRDHTTSWDRAVTRELDEELRQLEAVSKRELKHAMRLVRDRWWKKNDPIRRDLDSGLGTGVKAGWLVPELGANAVALELPDLNNVCGRDLRGMLRMQITPSRGMMRKLFGDRSRESLDGEAGLLEAVEAVRAQMREKWGDGFDRPD